MEEMPIGRLMRDRKILRRIDYNLAVISRFVVLANIFIFLLVISVGGLYQLHSKTVLLLAIGLLILSAANLFLSLRFENLYGAGPARWRSAFFAVQLVTALFLGVFTALVVFLEGLSVNAFIVTLYIVGYSSIYNVEWSPYHRRNLFRQVAVCIPPIASYIVLSNLNGAVVAVCLFVVWAMLVRQSRLMYDRYWETVATQNELRTKAQDLAHSALLANDANQYKTEFLASLTHEIRTPMNNVLGILALLDDTELNDQQRELQRVAVNSGESLLSLIDDMLDYAKISAGQIQLLNNVFNVRRCLDQTIEVLGPRAHDKGIELSCVYADDIPLRMRGDSVRLAQLLSNLVSNAIKYSDGSDILVAIHFNKQSPREAELKVSVKDNGKGIDPSLQNNLFEAFSKKPTQSSASQVGTGLGLAISKGLARCMQGDIGFSSEQGVGTEFWFSVRLQVSTQQAQRKPGSTQLEGKRALVIGSLGSVSQSLVVELSRWGLQVEESAESSALAQLTEAERSESPFDLVFLNLPVTQKVNLELMTDLCATVKRPSTPIFALSSLAQRADAIRSSEADELPIQWLSKPITSDKIYRCLAKSFAGFGSEDTERSEAAQFDAVKGLRILLVEDNAVNQMVARGMLTKLGYVVSCVANGKEAIGLLEEKTFDLILMDCMMPVLDGYETTKAWREIEEESGDHIPIIAMTASVVEGEQQRCLAAGMDDYLSKPVNIEELNAKIRRWLGEQENNALAQRKLA